MSNITPSLKQTLNLRIIIQQDSNNKIIKSASRLKPTPSSLHRQIVGDIKSIRPCLSNFLNLVPQFSFCA